MKSCNLSEYSRNELDEVSNARLIILSTKYNAGMPTETQARLDCFITTDYLCTHYIY